MEQPLVQLSYVGTQRILKGLAATFLIVNASVTFWLRGAYEKQWHEGSKDPFAGEKILRLDEPSANSPYWGDIDEQKHALIVLGVFTLLLLFAYTASGLTLRSSGNTTVYVAGVITTGLGLLCSTISFFLMSSYTCGFHCYHEIYEKAIDEFDSDDKYNDYVYGHLADKWEALRISSICAGVGFLVTLIGHEIVWQKTLSVDGCYATMVSSTTRLNILRRTIKVFLYVGLLAITTGFAGAFNWFAYEVRELADDKVVTTKKLDLSHDDILSFLIAAGVGFILTACGEAASILLVTAGADDDAEPKTDVIGPRRC